MSPCVSMSLNRKFANRSNRQLRQLFPHDRNHPGDDEVDCGHSDGSGHWHLMNLRFASALILSRSHFFSYVHTLTPMVRQDDERPAVFSHVSGVQTGAQGNGLRVAQALPSMMMAIRRC